MITLGITGRSGCGKSTVTAVFAGHGVPLADADQISREILPELDEDYAKKLGFPDLDALKKMIAEQANRNKAASVRSEAEAKQWLSEM